MPIGRPTALRQFLANRGALLWFYMTSYTTYRLSALSDGLSVSPSEKTICMHLHVLFLIGSHSEKKRSLRLLICFVHTVSAECFATPSLRQCN